MPSYLIEGSNEQARNYALAAAKDGKITYSISTNTNPIKANWINRIYEYMGKLLGIKFVEANEAGEFRLTLADPDYKDLPKIDYLVSNSGEIHWSSVHNTKQYGGVEDQRMLVRAIGNSLGLSRLNWKWREAGNTGEYTSKNTIMSNTPWDRGFDWGHTVFYTEDDKNALKLIYNSIVTDGVSGDHVLHIQRVKEDLLIGANGQIDEFRLVAKGMNADNKNAIWRDPITGLDWVNDYNIPTIVNFNPYEGDRILISRRLFMPANPINPQTPVPIAIKVGDGIKEVDSLTYLNNIKINFKLNLSNADEQETILTSKNVMFNDAGKLMLNVNGEHEGYGPPPVTGNGQLLAFIDAVGANLLEFKSEWIVLMNEIDDITNPSPEEHLYLAGNQIKFDKDSSNYKLYNLGSGRFRIKENGSESIDIPSSIDSLSFNDKTVSITKDIKEVFDQVDSINAPSAQIFRLYNAAFARFPDAEGLRYWINDYKTQNIKNISSNFIISNEFISKYGQNNATSNFVDNLYLNILGRLPDESGKNYWVNQINSGKETRSLVLLGFSESIENKGIFSDLTGLK